MMLFSAFANILTLSTRQRKNKLRTYALRTDDIDVLLMCINDFFNNTESQPCTGTILTSGQVLLVKTVPDLGQIFLWNTAALILDRDKHKLIFPGSLNSDHGMLITEFDRIIDQIVHHLLNLLHIGRNKFLR